VNGEAYISSAIYMLEFRCDSLDGE